MQRTLFRNASWVSSKVSTSDNQKKDLVQRAVQAAVELLEPRQLLSAGQLDTSFGAGGQVELTAQGTIYASAVQSDGKIILAGGTTLINQGGTSSFLVERLTANGGLDPTFGTNGVVTTPFAASAQASSVQIESDGKIVVGGGLDLARYNTNGSLDSTFGTGGKLTVAASSDINIQSLTVTSTNKVVVTGRTTFQDSAHPADPNYALNAFSVARFSADGTLDTSFNSTGTFIEQIPTDANNDATQNVATLDFAGRTSGLTTIALQSDEKILVGGSYKSDPALWRFNVDGTLDGSFGHAGMANIAMNVGGFSNDQFNSATITSIAQQPDGRILAGGFANQGDSPYSPFMVARFNADGSPDSTFGDTLLAAGGGLAFLNGYASNQAPYTADLLLQPDGKIIIGGSAGSMLDNVVRLNADGTVDSTFQFNNFDFDPNGFSGRYTSLDFTPDGQIILTDNPQVSGNTPNMQATGVVRIQNDYVASTSVPASTKTVNVAAGGINPTFGAQGDVLVNDPTTVWAQSSPQRAVRATAVQADGKILIAGSIGTVSTIGIGQIFIERLNADGSTDTTFGTNGFVQTTIGAFSVANAIAVQSDGKIVIGGLTEDSATAPTNQQFALARYTTAGVLDSTFGTGGIVTTDFTGNEQVDAIAIETGGQILAAGSYFQNPDVGFHVVRYTSSGSIDTTFNTTGKLTVNLGTPASGTPSYPTSVAVQSDAKILIGSFSAGNAAIYRYNANGSIDGGFGTSGIALNANTSTGGSISAMTVLASGKIVAATVNQSGNGTSTDLTRFSAAGIADSTFGTGGTVFLNSTFRPPESEPLDPTFPKYDTVDLLVPQSDGGIIAVGTRPALEASNYPVGLMPLVSKVASDGTVDTTFTDSADPGFLPSPYFRGEVVRAAAVAPDGSIFIAADVDTETTNSSIAPHGVSSPHAIGIANYITQATSYQVAVPASGVDFTPSQGGGGGGGGGGGNPLPAGQLTAKIPTALPRSVIGGTRGVLNIVIKNTAATTFSGPISIGLFSSLDSTVSADDARLTTLTLSSVTLKPGKTRTVRVPFNYASTQATGNYEILANVIETAQGTASYVAAPKRPIRVVQPTADLSMTIDPKGPLTLKAGKKTRMVLTIKNLGNVASVGTVTAGIYAVDPSQAHLDITLAEKTIKKFRLAKNATRRITLDYAPVSDFGSSFDMRVQLGSDTTPADPNTNGNNVAHVQVTLI